MALTSEKLLQAEYVRLRFAITPEPNETLADVMAPRYWVHVAAKLKPHSIVEVVPQDGSYYAELFVDSCGPIWANMRLLTLVTFTEKAEITTPKTPKKKVKLNGKEYAEEDVGIEHYVDWGGPQSKARVIRIKDKQIVHEGLPNKEAARVWMKDHESKAGLVAQANENLIG